MVDDRKLYNTMRVTKLFSPNYTIVATMEIAVINIMTQYLIIWVKKLFPNMALYLYSANILLYMIGGYLNIYNSWFFSLIIHSKTEIAQFGLESIR